MSIAAPNTSTISASELAERISRAEPVLLFDVRPDAEWGIDGPGVTRRQVRGAEALEQAVEIARETGAPPVVICARGISARAVASELGARGVDASVLEGGMRGWIALLQARRVPLEIENVEIHQVQRPGRGCLSYVVTSEGEALVVDPAPDVEYYEDLASSLGATVTQVVDTHIHADHLSGARALAEHTGARLRLPAAALERGVTFADRVHPLRDGDRIELGSTEVGVLALPGHTSDMTGLLVGERALIGGDSLFADGLARPDLENRDPEGSRAMARTLHSTLHERILVLGDDIVLLPGHTGAGVRADAVAPTLGEVRAAVPELAIKEPDAFAEKLTESMPPRPANYEAVIDVNLGRAQFDADLETGGNSCASR